MVWDMALGSLATLVQPTFILISYWMIESFATIFSLWHQASLGQDKEHFEHALKYKGIPKSFDFIVVGGGSAGGILVNRLVQNHYSVLLLEAGGEPMPFQYIPQFQLFLFNYPETDWMYKSVPQKRASLNSVNAQSSWSAGKVLGGTGTINALTYLRGHRRDFDNWANISGDSSWSWSGVLPHFKSYEDYYIPNQEEYHGYGGDLRIEQTDFLTVAPEFIQAAKEMGYPQLDVNGAYDEAGFDYIRYPMRNGYRIGTYKAFLEPIKYQQKLTIMKYAHVHKVLFKEDNQAYGVQYERHGKMMTAYADKEVILSAGSVGTPKILMLSGIGPRKHLEELNIPIVRDLPVGKNLQDHLGVYLGPFFLDKPKSLSLERDITPSAILKWLTSGKGPLCSAGPTATGLWTSKYASARGEENWPDINLHLACYTLFGGAGKHNAHAYGLKLDEMLKYYEHAANKDSCHVLVSGARPLSRGYLKLGGSSPYDDAIIEPNYLGDKDDVDFKVLMEGVKGTLHLFENTTAMGTNIGARFTTEKLPGCEHLEFRSEAYWECYIRRYTVTLHHPVGTASMGQVVDGDLKVLGTKGLRVVDASIQPVLVATNTQASTIMIGSKGAHTILKYWNKQRKMRNKGNYI